MKHAIILGVRSDIGREISQRLKADGWRITSYHHIDKLEPTRVDRWDLIVCCYGTLEPIGPFWGTTNADWERAFDANLFLPMRQIRAFYPSRQPGASVCFFSGAGTNGLAPTYSAYAASKIALVKMTELLDDESPDCKFFILGPGVVRTKIHIQTLLAGARAGNVERVYDFVASGAPGTSHDDIYACLMACVAAPKAAVGGRNFYVPGDDMAQLGALVGDRNALRLRRDGDGLIRRAEVANEGL